MIRTAVFGAVALGLAGAGGAGAMTIENATGYAIADSGNSLVRMKSIGDTSSYDVFAVTADGAPVTINALAWRPVGARLYGVSAANDTVYEIDPTSGMATAVAVSADAVWTGQVGFDFNNVLDAARIVTTTEQNMVFFPNNTPPNVVGAPTITPLAYGVGDPNFGADPSIMANAYTNAVPGATETLQFVLDSELDILGTLANNAGTITTVGEIWLGDAKLDFLSDGGMDILSFAEGDNTAYALLNTGAGSAIYKLGLEVDALGRIYAELITNLGADFSTTFTAFAIAAEPAQQVPVPAAGLLLAPAIGGLAAMRLRRRRKAAA